MNDFLSVTLGRLKDGIDNGADVIFGTVVSIEPLQIQVSDKLILPQELLILSKRVAEYTLIVDGQTVTIDDRLALNDKVVMIKRNGGQSFFVLEKAW